jgi:hypothetical protein
VFPHVPHQLCHFHDLREAAKPIYDADRHAKKALKKRVRGVRPIERRLDGRRDPAAEVGRGYCAAVRSALTDDGRPPLEASGLKLHDRLRLLPVSSGSKKGGLAPGTAAAEMPAGARLEGHGCFMARRTGRVSLGPSGRPYPQQPGPA